LFSGFTVFLPGNFRSGDFLSTYANVFVFLALYLTWKRVTHSQLIEPAQMKLKAEFDAIQKEAPDTQRSAGYTLVPENDR